MHMRNSYSYAAQCKQKMQDVKAILYRSLCYVPLLRFFFALHDYRLWLSLRHSAKDIFSRGRTNVSLQSAYFYNTACLLFRCSLQETDARTLACTAQRQAWATSAKVRLVATLALRIVVVAIYCQGKLRNPSDQHPRWRNW